MSSQLNIKELFINALILQFVILFSTGYLAYLLLLYPNYSDEFGFGRKIELVEGVYNTTILTGRTESILIIKSKLPTQIFLDNDLKSYGTYNEIRLKQYLLVNLSIVGEPGVDVFIRLRNEVPIYEVFISVALLLLSIPLYINSIRRMRRGSI